MMMSFVCACSASITVCSTEITAEVKVSVHLNILSFIRAVLQQAKLPQLLRGHVSLCAKLVMVPALSEGVKVSAETW